MSNESTTTSEPTGQVCLNHCTHDPRWVVGGVCRHTPVVIYPTDEAEECGHRCLLSPRVCQRGRDGSPGCGHTDCRDERGYCQGPTDTNEPCGCLCDFSPEAEKVGTHEFEPREDHLYPHERCPRCGEEFETRRQRDTHLCQVCVSPSPVHKHSAEVESEPQVDFCYAEGDEGAEYCGDPKAMHCSVLGPAAFWKSAEGQKHLVKCMRDDHFVHHRFVAAPPTQSIPPPARGEDVRISKELFNIFHEGVMTGYGHGPSQTFRVEISHRDLEKHQRFYELLYDLFNPTPLECPMCGAPKAFAVYPYDPSTGYCSVEDKSWTIKLGPAYAHLEPIQKALEACETCLSADPVEWYTCWKALVASVKGEK